VLFVTQVPNQGNPFNQIVSTFANHLPDVGAAPRGGDLWIAYPNTNGPAMLRNLSAEAGLGNNIAVREPSVHWDGHKALVSIVSGASASARWQIYEIEGLLPGQTAKFTRLPQPSAYNHMGAVYDSKDNIVMVSDMPRAGPSAEFRHLYPQLDEYEQAPTNTGLWRLETGSGLEGKVTLLHHAPSGAFRPQLDSFGRLIATNWDHLQRDQQSGGAQYGLFNWPDESNGPRDPGPDTGAQTQVREVFPERFGKGYRDGVHDLTFNFFLPWMFRQDGSEAETLNHIGRHELGLFGFASRGSGSPGFGLSDLSGARGVNAGLVSQGVKLDAFHHLREDPLNPGLYYGVRAQEFGTRGGGCVLTIQGKPTQRPQDMRVSLLTPASTCAAGGAELHRNPLPTSDGRLLSSVSTVTGTVGSNGTPGYNYRLYFLKKNGATFVHDPSGALTPGLTKQINGASQALWELDAVELRARTRPPFTMMDPIPGPEAAVFQQEGVDAARFRQFLADNRLALIVSRDVTRRDTFDRQQPFNLRVRGGTAQSTATGSGSAAPVWEIDHLQVFQAEQLRGIQNDVNRGRRVLAQPAKPIVIGGKLANPAAAAQVPVGSVKLGADGSMAALVRAERATTWQLIDSATPGDPALGTDGVVRERFWLSFRPGEVRVCATCHGVSERDQTGGLHETVANPPEALRTLLRHYKTNLEAMAVATTPARKTETVR
jgi:hypothetical protein